MRRLRKNSLKNLFFFIFFFVITLFFYHSLFGSYFEGDEWFAFTFNLPLTHDPLGFLKVMVMEGGDSDNLVQSQHIVPISREVFFLNTLFFGTNFTPYALMAILFHSLNAFLVFYLIRLFLPRKLSFAVIGAIFFVVSPVHMHAVTWAATYGTNSLPVTLSLVSVILFKLAYLKKNKKFVYTSLFVLFLALATKETSIIIFAILPLMSFFEKRTFTFKFLSKVFLACIVLYLVLRFLLPGIYSISSSSETKIEIKDTKTVVSRDTSIYDNIYSEVAYRAVMFPIRMAGTVFLPRKTLFSFVEYIAPFVTPVPPGGDTLGRLAFIYGSGNYVVIYLVGLGVIFFSLISVVKYIKKRKLSEAQAIFIGLAFIVLTALPLVIIVLSFPRWGYDFYFDSRYYYSASIGGAIIFPFLLAGFSTFFAKNLRSLKYSFVFIILFSAWFIQNINVFNASIPELTGNYRPDRRDVVMQLKKHLPFLPQKIIFYFETDGESAYGRKLPFDTSVAQALTVVYYKESPLPNNFYAKPLFLEKTEGYQEDDGHGFGYFISKEDLIRTVQDEPSLINNVYGFYYNSQSKTLESITVNLRKELKESIIEN